MNFVEKLESQANRENIGMCKARVEKQPTELFRNSNALSFDVLYKIGNSSMPTTKLDELVYEKYTYFNGLLSMKGCLIMILKQNGLIQ